MTFMRSGLARPAENTTLCFPADSVFAEAGCSCYDIGRGNCDKAAVDNGREIECVDSSKTRIIEEFPMLTEPNPIITCL